MIVVNGYRKSALGQCLVFFAQIDGLLLCRSEHARDELESTAGCLAASVIVGDHRERARSYRDYRDFRDVQ